MTAKTPPVRKTYSIRIEGYWELPVASFFGGPKATATAAECAEEVRTYISERGFDRFMSEWNLDELDVYVDNELVARDGVPT